MAAPITHIVLADKVFNLYFQQKSKSDFYAGTSFPDIRYLSAIDRGKTHSHEANLAEVIALPSFAAGVKFHSLVDLIRENFYRKNDLYSQVPASIYATQAVKVYEDILFYNKIKEWGTISKYFDQTYFDELAYNVKTEDIQRWHSLLKQYIQKQPDIQNIKNFIEGISGDRKTMYDEIVSVIEEIKDIQVLKNKIKEMYDSFERLLVE